MSSTLEQIEKNIVKVTIELEAARFEEGMQYAYNKNKSKFKIDGFRKGTVPRKVLEGMYGEAVLYDDAVEYVFPKAYQEALIEHKLDPVAMPEVAVSQIGNGKNLVLEVKVTTRPEVELGKYVGIEVEKRSEEVTDEEVDAKIKEECEKNARLVSVDRKAKDGDVVNIDYVGSIDDKVFEGGSAQKYDLVLGSKTFIDNFEEQLEGKSVGEEVNVKVKFPEDYGNADLNGKDAEFKVTINSISEKVYPELNDEFAQDVSEFSTLKEYKDDVKAKLGARKKFEIIEAKQEEILKKVCEDSKVDIPEVMIDNHVRVMINNFSRDLSSHGMTLDAFMKYSGGSIETLKSHYRADAEKSVKMALVLDAIAKKENIDVSEEEVNAKLENISTEIKKPVDEIKKILGTRIIEIKEELIVDKTIEFLDNNSIEK